MLQVDWPINVPCAVCRATELLPLVECPSSAAIVRYEPQAFVLCEDCGVRFITERASGFTTQRSQLPPHQRLSRYNGDPLPAWVLDGTLVKVKATPDLRRSGLRARSLFGHPSDDRAWPGEVGTIRRRLGNGWWDMTLVFERERLSNIDVSVLERVSRLKELELFKAWLERVPQQDRSAVAPIVDLMRCKRFSEAQEVLRELPTQLQNVPGVLSLGGYLMAMVDA